MPVAKRKRPAGMWYERAKRGRTRGLKHGYRSGLEEANGRHLERHGEPVLFETFKIPYVVPMQQRTYTPDFALSNGIIIETKGIWDATDRAKHLLVRVQWPDLDIRLVFTRAKSPIAPGSSTTLGEWADKHGIKWAEKLIPVEWINEPGPTRHYLDVLKGDPLGYETFVAGNHRKRAAK